MRRELATVVLIGLTLGSPSVGQAADLELESVPEGGRIEIPEAGFAITLPSDWRYTRPTLALIDELASSVPDGSVALARLLEELENDPPWLIALGPGSQGCDVSSLEAYDLSHDDFFAQTAAELADLGLDIRMDRFRCDSICRSAR